MPRIEKRLGRYTVKPVKVYSIIGGKLVLRAMFPVSPTSQSDAMYFIRGCIQSDPEKRLAVRGLHGTWAHELKVTHYSVKLLSN